VLALIVGTGAVAHLKLSLLVSASDAPSAIDTKAPLLAMRRGRILAEQSGEPVLILDDSLSIADQCTGIAIAKELDKRGIRNDKNGHKING